MTTQQQTGNGKVAARGVNMSNRGRPMPTGRPYGTVLLVVPGPSRRKHQPEPRSIARSTPMQQPVLAEPEQSRSPTDRRARRGEAGTACPTPSGRGPAARSGLAEPGRHFDGQRACTCVNCHHARARWARRSAGRCRHGLLRAGRVGLSSRGLADLLAIQGRRSS